VFNVLPERPELRWHEVQFCRVPGMDQIIVLVLGEFIAEGYGSCC